jgi:hypothetical protein
MQKKKTLPTYIFEHIEKALKERIDWMSWICGSNNGYIQDYICHDQWLLIIRPDHLLLDSAANIGPPVSRWEINNFENIADTKVLRL